LKQISQKFIGHLSTRSKISSPGQGYAYGGYGPGNDSRQSYLSLQRLPGAEMRRVFHL
jgi:hypothetical protein